MAHHPARAFAARFAALGLVATLAGPHASGTPRRMQPPLEPPIRVGLVRRMPGAPAYLVVAGVGATLVDTDGARRGTGPAVWTLRCGDDSRVHAQVDGTEIAAATLLRIDPGSTEATTSVARLVGGAGSRPGRAAAYRGTLEIRPAPGVAPNRLTVINELPLDDYLRGVISSEMASSAAAAALRAQAITSRTYALMEHRNCRYARSGYDVTDDTACQMYDGVAAETPATDSAVRNTAGLVLTRGGDIFMADFYDDCGGVTAPGDSDQDFPPSVADSAGAGQPDYCAAGHYHTWTLELTAAEMGGHLRSLTPDGATLATVEVVQTDGSGRAQSIRLGFAPAPVQALSGQGALDDLPADDVTAARTDHGRTVGNGSRFIARATAFRTLRASELRRVLGYDRLRSTFFTVAQSADGGWVFRGRGWGHGHGLCQAGAMGMAAAPYRRSCEDILTHYYPGAQISCLTDTMVAPRVRGMTLTSRGGTRQTTRRTKRPTTRQPNRRGQ